MLPKVSLTIVAYKAERFIKEAVEGAFAQEYPNLEIVLSDDCSTDKTFEIMQSSVAEYKGPHKVVLNRNETNLGLAAHVNKVFFDLATGDWIIVSAGDDVSLPGRVSRVMEFAGSDVGALHHKCIAIDDNGNEKGYLGIPKNNLDLFSANDYRIAIKHRLWLKGASACYNRDMLNMFGKINTDVTNEDKVYAYRSLFFGKVIYLDEPLMKYRKHESGITNVPQKWDTKNYVNYKIKIARWNISLCKQILHDDTILHLDETLKKGIKNLYHKSSVILYLYGKEMFTNSNKDFQGSSILYYREKIKIKFLKLYIKIFNLYKTAIG